MWVQRGGPPEQPVILFHYDPSRGQAQAERLLVGYRGYLQSDGLEVYAALAAKYPEIRPLGCMARAQVLRTAWRRGTYPSLEPRGVGFVERLHANGPTERSTPGENACISQAFSG